MFTSLASKLFSKTATSETSRPRRASAIRKQQVLRQSAAYYGDVYNEFDVYEEQNPWTDIVEEDEEQVVTEVRYKAALKQMKTEELQPSVSQLLKKLAVNLDQSVFQPEHDIRSYSALFPPPPLATIERGYSMSAQGSYRRGVDFGVGLPPAA